MDYIETRKYRDWNNYILNTVSIDLTIQLTQESIHMFLKVKFQSKIYLFF